MFFIVCYYYYYSCCLFCPSSSRVWKSWRTRVVVAVVAASSVASSFLVFLTRLCLSLAMVLLTTVLVAALGSAASNGHLDVLQWLRSEFELTAEDARDNYALRLAAENAQDPIAIPHRRHFRIGHNDGFVGIIKRHLSAFFDTGGAIANNKIELVAQLFWLQLDP